MEMRKIDFFSLDGGGDVLFRRSGAVPSFPWFL